MLFFHMLIVRNADGKYNLCVKVNNSKHLCMFNGEVLSFDTLDECDAFLTIIRNKDYFKTDDPEHHKGGKLWQKEKMLR